MRTVACLLGWTSDPRSHRRLGRREDTTSCSLSNVWSSAWRPRPSSSRDASRPPTGSVGFVTSHCFRPRRRRRQSRRRRRGAPCRTELIPATPTRSPMPPRTHWPATTRARMTPRWTRPAAPRNGWTPRSCAEPKRERARMRPGWIGKARRVDVGRHGTSRARPDA